MQNKMTVSPNAGENWKYPTENYTIREEWNVTYQADLATGRERQLTTESARKGLNTTTGAQFTALPVVKPVVWFARAFVNWRSRSVAKSAY